MNETVTGITLLAGIISMLLALYHTKSNRKRAGRFLIAMIVFYTIAAISIFTDNKNEALIDYFQNGGKLICRDIPVSKELGWSVKGDDYLTKDEQIFYIKMCRKL